jgi:peptidoglycan/xylan/chitin deacetylase (PgdA/CDA1 family)
MVYVALVLIVVCYVVYFLPESLLDVVLQNQNVVYRNSDGSVTFTFDDSPSENTEDILDCLKEHDTKAIFFILSDNIKGNEHILDRIVNEGHVLGNHGAKDVVHVTMDAETFEQEVMECHSKLQPWTPHPTYFRPGFGFFNASMTDVLQRHGYTIMLGNVFPYDSYITSPTINTWYIERKVKSGSIIVLHDRPWTVPTLHRVLHSNSYLRNQLFAKT